MGRQANASSHNRLQHFAFCRFFHREKTLYRLVHDFLAVPLDPGCYAARVEVMHFDGLASVRWVRARVSSKRDSPNREQLTSCAAPFPCCKPRRAPFPCWPASTGADPNQNP